MEMSMMRSGMVRSGISRIAIQHPPSKGAVCMRYLVLMIVMFFSMFLFGIAFYFVFLHKEKKKTEDPDVISPEQCDIIDFTPVNEDPPLICSLDGHEKVLKYPELLCSHIVFLSAVVVSASQVKPADGLDAGLRRFKDLRRIYGRVKKLLSFNVAEISAFSMNDIHTAYLSIASDWLDGIDIRYMSGNEPALHLFKDLRKLADGKGYIIHGIFDSVKMDVMKDFHIATLRVYKELTPPGPFKAVSPQQTEDVENGVSAYESAVTGANLNAYGNHCIAFTLAAVQYNGARALGDNAVDFAKVPYCSEEYERKGSAMNPNGHSHFVRNDKVDSLFVFEVPKNFKNKVLKIGRLPNACLVIDDVYYDRHRCSCDDTNFKLLKTARKVLWQSLRG